MRCLKSGFTLLEVLVSMTLLLLVSASSLVLVVSARQLTQKPGNRSGAVYYATETLNILKEYVTFQTTDAKYQLLVGGVPSGTYALQGGGPYPYDLPSPSPLSGANREYTVTDVDLDPLVNSDGVGTASDDADYKRVGVTVRWTETN